MKTQKLIWLNIMRSTKNQKVSILHYNIDMHFFWFNIYIGTKSLKIKY